MRRLVYASHHWLVCGIGYGVSDGWTGSFTEAIIMTPPLSQTDLEKLTLNHRLYYEEARSRIEAGKEGHALFVNPHFLASLIAEWWRAREAGRIITEALVDHFKALSDACRAAGTHERAAAYNVAADNCRTALTSDFGWNIELRRALAQENK